MTHETEMQLMRNFSSPMIDLNIDYDSIISIRSMRTLIGFLFGNRGLKAFMHDA